MLPCESGRRARGYGEGAAEEAGDMREDFGAIKGELSELRSEVSEFARRPPKRVERIAHRIS
jgi:hypothetical protein